MQESESQQAKQSSLQPNLLLLIQKPSLAQLFNAVEIATMVRSDEEFNQEVQSWVAASVVDEGVFYAPQPIRFCQDEILQLMRELKLPEPESQVGAVQQRFREVLQIPSDVWARAGAPILEETAVDIQVAKLKVAYNYLELRRRQLQHQLRFLR